MKIIILILSSNGSIYKKLKELQTYYLNQFKQIEFIFVEFENDITLEESFRPEKHNFSNEISFNKETHTLTCKGSESITPGMIIKTCKALEYINENYEYDFLFRTNLSTFININKLIDFLNNLPTINVCAGFSFSGFITGTGLIMTKDVTNIVINNYEQFNYTNICEDVLISQILGHYKVKYYNPVTYNYKWGLIIDNETTDSFPNFIYYITYGQYKDFIFDSNILHWRIKNTSNRELDIQYFNKLIANYKLLN
jgi:hypothetical protein